MTQQEIARLIEQRAQAYDAMNEALGQSEDGALEPEAREAYDRAEADFDRLDDTIRRHQRKAERDRSASPMMQRHAEDPERAEAQDRETRGERFERAIGLAEQSPANRQAFLRSDEYREAFAHVVLRGDVAVPEYRAALNLGTDAEGGYTAPEEFVRELYREAAEFSVLRRYARNIPTSHGRELQFPEVATTGGAGWTNEEVTTAPDDYKSEPTFGPPKTLKAHPAQREVVTSKDLLQDSVFNIEALVRDLIAESFVELADEAYMTGDGNGKPTGIIPGLSPSMIVTGAASDTAVITVDDLIDVQHKPRRRYRGNARWILTDAALKAVRKLEDGDGQKIWQPGLTEGEPGRILGKPYDVDEFVPVPAAGADTSTEGSVSILYGDFSGYWTRDVLAVNIQRLVETYARNRQVGFLADMRTDGKLIRPNRVAAYQHGVAAS